MGMATEKQAKKAKEQYFDFLLENGAHTLAVDMVDKEKADSFGVLIFAEGDTKKIPKELEVSLNGKKTKVPVIIEKSQKFKPQ